MELPIYAVAALAAVGLGTVRRENFRLSRHEYQVSVRPLLTEMPRSNDGPIENVRFGAPRHNTVELPIAGIYVREDEKLLQISVPFHNVGQGAAVITSARTEPRGMGSVLASKVIVPVGERTRINASLQLNSSALGAKDQRLTSGHFTLNIEYTDADGNQPMVTRAHIRRFAADRSFVGPIDVTRRGESEPFLSSRPIDGV